MVAAVRPAASSGASGSPASVEVHVATGPSFTRADPAGCGPRAPVAARPVAGALAPPAARHPLGLDGAR